MWPFRSRPSTELPHVRVRYIAATKRESRIAQQKRTDVLLELAVYAATTTPEQRKAEADAFHEQFMLEWQGMRNREVGEGR